MDSERNDDTLELVREKLTNLVTESKDSNFSVDGPCRLSDLRNVFLYLMKDTDVVWEDIVHGRHPDLKEYVAILNKQPEEDDGTSSLKQSVSQEVENTSNPNTQAKLLDGVRKPTETPKLLESAKADDEGTEQPRTKKEIFIFKSRKTYEDESSDEVKKPHAQDKAAAACVSIETLVQESKCVANDLSAANKRFRSVIKDPLQEATEDSEKEQGALSKQKAERRKWLDPQNDAKQVEWSSSDESVVSTPATTVKRRKKAREKIPWTEEEMHWIRDGIAKFGVGNWAKIRDYYPFSGQHKNSVRIKDKYRTMKSANQLL